MILSHFQTRPLSAPGVPTIMPLSLDLGLTTVKVHKTPEGWECPDGQILSFPSIQAINADQNSCFQLVDGQIHKIEAFSAFTHRYYSLMPSPQAPTMLISGIPMHRIKETTPIEDTHLKIKALGKPFRRILDTATGLGYTAIAAAQTAREVITIEFDPTVLDIARVNPWSQRLFTHPNIHQLIGDCFELIAAFEDESFNAILHDPPTFNLAGHLYSHVIYQTFFRILKPGGRLFHYIGNPHSRTGARVGRGVVERLQKAGFKVTPKERAHGVLARK